MSSEHRANNIEVASPREMFREYVPGEELELQINHVGPHEEFTEVDRVVIDSVAGGGFFGRVLIPEDRDYVVKTSVPSPFHYFLRFMNWEKTEFPPQHSEIAAKRTVVATRLIANALPIISGERFISPTAYGYTRLPEGYAYIVEKMNGRGPRYDMEADEFGAFREAQQELMEHAYDLGLEHVGQIHPDNPFGMANLWKNPETGQWIWLDTIPAIPHRGNVWPGIHYEFHDEIREYFGSPEPTFDRIHTDMFKATIDSRRGDFSEEQYAQIQEDLRLYDDLVAAEQPVVVRDATVASYALAKALKDKPITLGKSVIRAGRELWRDPESLITKGVDEARAQNYISVAELESVMELLEPAANKGELSNANFYRALVIYYNIVGRSTDALAGYAGFDAFIGLVKDLIHNQAGAHDVGPEMIQGLVALGVWAELPPILAYIGTKAAGSRTGKDVEVALKVLRRLPLRGMGYAALAAQAGVGTVEKTAFHYQLRHLLAKLHGILPDGGWGTEREGRVWERIGHKLEERLVDNI